MRPGALSIALPKGNEGEKPKPKFAFSMKNQNRAYGAINKQLPRNPAKTSGEKADFTPFKISVNHVLNAIKDQDWVRRLRPLPPNPKGSGDREYCVFHDGMGHRTIVCCSLWRQL